LKTEVLPHVGHDFRQKAFFLGFMVNRLLLRYFKYFPLDDRDSYINKRVDLPGLLLANLYKTNWTTKFLKDVSNALKKEIDRGQWKASGNIDEIISPANIYKIVKSTTMEASIKYAMATGNFGMKNTTNKVGISQVLSRLNYNAMISHLRRVNTPIDKTAKLVAPRKLHST
jgi:DNA-directed RNA polymerase II subunit RPB2